MQEPSTAVYKDKRHSFLGKPIEITELQKALKRLKRNKLPGSDGILNEFYKHFPQVNAKFMLLRIMNEVIEKGTIPDN